MARKCRKLICVQGSQRIRDSEDGLASEVCQKGIYWAFNESSFSWTWAEARPEWCLQWNGGKGCLGEDGKDCSRSPGSQQNHCPLESFNSQLGRGLSILIWLWSWPCTQQVVLETSRHLSWPIALNRTSYYWQTLRGAAVGTTSTAFFSVLLDEKGYSCKAFSGYFFMLDECTLLRWV